jgi:AcrR family transcriptional regulator
MARENRGVETRRRLIATAAEALIDGGGDFEMGQLAQRAQVSAGLPYHYFGSKAGALSAVVDDFYDRYYAAVNRDLAGEAPWAERELRRLKLWIGFLYGDPLSPIVLGKMGRSVQVAGVEATRQDQLIGLARRNIETGQRGGEIPEEIDAGIAAAAIIGAIRQAVSHAFAERKRPDPRVLTDQLWALIAGALGLAAPRSMTETASPEWRRT